MTAPRADKASRIRAERETREALAHMLPTPEERDLPPGRHEHHKERLMREIDDEQYAAQAVSDAGGGSPVHHDRPGVGRFRLLRPAVVAPAAAVALGGALTAGLLSGGDASGRPDQGTASAELGRISEAAMAHDTVPQVRDSQYTYVKSKVRGADETSGKAVTGPLKSREEWHSQRQGPVMKLGSIREDGETIQINPDLGDDHGTPAGIDRPTYRWLSSLPTDPDELLKYLYEHASESGELERDQVVFEEIGRLVGGVVPTEVEAALFKAAAKLPGVARAPQAKDAIGRNGVGIARTDTRNGERTEWVFDEDSLDYLGSRTYLTKTNSLGKAGTLLSSEAVLKRGVADKMGKQPKPSQVVSSSSPSQARG
ncbi:CU044_5270 family protein [Streptomyces xiaopingdaonensis]|uniref:CU044_5270 family protein n=1 Tax=Streptomyces xiaopingdaonensis TaxID=1565415 RepID=UPI00030A47B1|nr:CU044_5270 family protein [Streptomyces xiaopingdaonensis]